MSDNNPYSRFVFVGVRDQTLGEDRGDVVAVGLSEQDAFREMQSDFDGNHLTYERCDYAPLGGLAQ